MTDTGTAGPSRSRSRPIDRLLLGPDVLDRCQGSVVDLEGRLLSYAVRQGLRLSET